MIKASQLTQQMIDIQKLSFRSYCDAAAAMQHQATSTMDLMLKQAGWIPREGRQAISAWMDACNQESERIMEYVDKSLANLGMCFTAKETAAPAKTKKPTASKPKKTATTVQKMTAKSEAPKAVPAAVKKTAPVESPKAAPAGQKVAKAAAVKKTSAAKKPSKKVLK